MDNVFSVTEIGPNPPVASVTEIGPNPPIAIR